MKNIMLVVCLVALLSGCANPKIVKLSPDTYMLSREDHAGIFGSSAKMKSDVIRDANKFAESQSKVAIPVAMKEHPVGILADWATCEYQFRVVDKNDPEAQRTSLVPKAEIEADKKAKIFADMRNKNITEKQIDLYAELTKLDDLRKKHLLTDAEFETQKKILFDRQQSRQQQSVSQQIPQNDTEVALRQLEIEQQRELAVMQMVIILVMLKHVASILISALTFSRPRNKNWPA